MTWHLRISTKCNIYSNYICSDNYGFITYQYTSDAFRAIEEGNMNLRRGEVYYDLCFGGRREFCKVAYADLGRFCFWKNMEEFLTFYCLQMMRRTPCPMINLQMDKKMTLMHC